MQHVIFDIQVSLDINREGWSACQPYKFYSSLRLNSNAVKQVTASMWRSITGCVVWLCWNAASGSITCDMEAAGAASWAMDGEWSRGKCDATKWQIIRGITFARYCSEPCYLQSVWDV